MPSPHVAGGYVASGLGGEITGLAGDVNGASLPGEPGRDGTLLGRRARPIENCVPVWEAAEARDHAMMADREGPAIAVRQPAEMTQASFLVEDVFAMHQRHRQELSLRKRQAGSPSPIE